MLAGRHDMSRIPHTDSRSFPAKVQGKVLKVTQLTFDTDEPKYRTDIEIPDNLTYDVGDCLNVYPSNVQRPIAELGDLFRIRNTLPTAEGPVLVSDEVIHSPVDLKRLELLIDCCTSRQDIETFRAAKESLCRAPDHLRPSIPQLLEAYPSIKLRPCQLSVVLPPLRPREYFISSSPLTSPSRCSLIWSLKTDHFPGFNSQDGTTSVEMASHYLAQLTPGDTLTCALGCPSKLRLPADPRTPIIMVSDGAAIAPFVGFVEQRAEQVRRDPELWDEMSPALLFVAYSNSQQALCPLELGSSGVVDVRYAFYDYGEEQEGDFIGTVDERMWADRDDIVQLWDRGAMLFVCGTTPLLEAEVEGAMVRILQDASAKRGRMETETEVRDRWRRVLRDRYKWEVFCRF